MRAWLFGWVLALCAVPLQAQDTLRVRIGDGRPLAYQDEKAQCRGLNVDLLHVLLTEAKITPVYLTMPWKRALEQLKKGDVDLVMNLSMTEERKQAIHFIGPVRSETIVVVVPKAADYSIASFDDFKRIRGKFVIRNGSYYGKAFHDKLDGDADFAAKFDARVKGGASPEIIQKERLAGYFSDEVSFADLLRQKPYLTDTLKLHGFVINRDYVYVGVNKHLPPAMIKRLEEAYARAKAAGKFEAVVKRYK